MTPDHQHLVAALREGAEVGDYYHRVAPGLEEGGDRATQNYFLPLSHIKCLQIFRESAYIFFAKLATKRAKPSVTESSFCDRNFFL